MRIFFPLSVCVLVVINVLDRSYATLFISLFIYLIGFLFSLYVNKENKKDSVLLFLTIFSIYLISSYVFSLSFHNGDFFLAQDPVRYIEQFSINWKFDVEYYKNYFYSCYFELSDNNALYNTYIRFLAFFANRYLGEFSILYATLGQTIFGILSSTILFKILLKFFPSKDSLNYALLFGLLSSFHFYSAVILRDIIIAFVYLLVLKIILEPFSFRGIFKLLFLLLIAWGIRLYSGLFIIIFIMYYIYIPLRNSKYNKLIIPLFIGVLLGITISSNVVIEQSIEEIKYYEEYSLERGERSGGLSNYLINLPVGIKQIVLALYSQFHPFPPFSPLLHANSFSQIYMSLLLFISSIWWAFIFFPLLIFLFTPGILKKIKLEFKILFLLAIIFIIANTAHIDIRRMMPVYPIFYLIFLFIKCYIAPRAYYRKVNYLMLFLILLASSFYLILI